MLRVWCVERRQGCRGISFKYELCDHQVNVIDLGHIAISSNEVILPDLASWLVLLRRHTTTHLDLLITAPQLTHLHHPSVSWDFFLPSFRVAWPGFSRAHLGVKIISPSQFFELGAYSTSTALLASPKPRRIWRKWLLRILLDLHSKQDVDLVFNG